MAETICIYDASGKKICYDNHAARASARIAYALWSTPAGARKPLFVRSGTLPGGACCLDKLGVVIAMATRQGWTSWRKITHLHKAAGKATHARPRRRSRAAAKRR